MKFTRLAIVLLVLMLLAGVVSAGRPSVKIVKIAKYWSISGTGTDGNAFSYFRDTNLRVDFNVVDIDINIVGLAAGTEGLMLKGALYSSTNVNAFTAPIIANLNILEFKTAGLPYSGSRYCDDFNFNSKAGAIASGGDPEDVNTGTTCHWDWNISSSLIADGNYFLDINVYDALGDNNSVDNTDTNFIIDNTAPTAVGANADFNMDVNKTGDYNGTHMFYPVGGGTSYPSTDAFVGFDQNITARIQERNSKEAGRSHIQSVDLNFWDVNSIRFANVNAAVALRGAGFVTWTFAPDINVQKFKYDSNVAQKYVRAVVTDWAGNQADYNLSQPLMMMGMIYPPGVDQNANGTSLQDVNNFERVKLLTFSKSGFGRIRFNQDVNLADFTVVTKLMNLQNALGMTRLATGDVNVWLDSVYLSDLNLTAGLTFFGVSTPGGATPGIKMAGDQNCGAVCSAITYTAATGQLDFNITHFTDYYTDANAPVITNNTPAAQGIPAVISVTTSENANCRYATTAITYSAMTNTMSGNGATSHSATITSGPGSGESANYYVACEDMTANASAGTSVSFLVTSGAGGGIMPVCGDGACNGTETAVSCPGDCAPICGDGACTGTESPESCPEDCLSYCGDSFCISPEDCSTCSDDCGTCTEVPATTIPGATIVNEQTQVSQPTVADIDSVLGDAGFTESDIETAKSVAESFGVSRNIKVLERGTEGAKTYESRVTISITNKTSETLKNVRVVEYVPKAVASSSSQISSSKPFAVLKDDPIIQFTFAEVASGKTASVSYSVAKKLEPSEVASYIVAPIPAYAVTEEEAECDFVDCDDKNPCTTDLCFTGECAYVLVKDGTSCGFGKECSLGICRSISAAAPIAGVSGVGIETVLLVVVVIIAALALMRYYKKKK